MALMDIMLVLRRAREWLLYALATAALFYLIVGE
jgi:hypothetical protein